MNGQTMYRYLRKWRSRCAKTVSRSALALGTAVLAMAAAAPAQEIRLPDIGNSAGAVVAAQEEREYGRALMREFRRRAQTVDDPLLEDYMNHLGYSLVAQSDDAERDFTFFIVDSNVVNAFAAPGGYIGIHSQLILEAETEAELAGVTAHEVAHVTQRHIARRIEAQSKLSLPLTLLMLGAVAAGAASGSTDAAQAGVVGVQAASAQLQINFTRNNEREADRVGIALLAKAGFDPNGMAEFFGRMQRISRNYGKAPNEFLRTHPVEAARIAEAKNRVDALTEDASRNDNGRDEQSFRFLRERLRVLTHRNPAELAAYYRQQLEQQRDPAALYYGAALARLRSNDPVGAAETLDRLDQRHAQRLPVQLLQAELETQLQIGRDTKYRALLARYPGSLAVSLSYADTLLERAQTGDAAKAERQLRPLLSRYPEHARLHSSYARAADAAGMPVRAGEAYAQQMYLHGRIFDAVSQLENLMAYSTPDRYQQARIEARLEQLRPLLEEIENERGYDPSEGRSRKPLKSRLASRQTFSLR